MKISVVIPTRNRAENLRNTLLALSSQSLPLTDFEVIVSDDNSTDGTKEVVEYYKGIFPNFRYIYNNHKAGTWNAATPRNIGAWITDESSLAILFVDSDVLLPANALECYVEDVQQNPNRVIIGSYNWLLPLSQDDIVKHVKNQEGMTDFFMAHLDSANGINGHDVRHSSFDSRKPDEVSCSMGDALACFGGNICFPRTLFFENGGYDDTSIVAGFEDIVGTQIGLEDGELGIRLWKSGVNFSYENRTIGYHQYHLPPADRFPADMYRYLHKLNTMHFGTVDPDHGIIAANREQYERYGIKDWEVPKQWLKK